MKWSKEYPPSGEIKYNHIKLQTPLGECIILTGSRVRLYLNRHYYLGVFTSTEEAQQFVSDMLKEYQICLKNRNYLGEYNVN